MKGGHSKKNPYSLSLPSNDPSDPWSANCAIPNLLFENQEIFKKKFRFLT